MRVAAPWCRYFRLAYLNTCDRPTLNIIRHARWLAAIALLAGSAICPSGIAAQSTATGIIRGVVTDSKAALLTDVFITLRDSTGVARSTPAGRAESFSFELLPPGDYTVRFEMVGYVPREISGISVRPGRAVEMKVTLAVATDPNAPVMRDTMRASVSRVGDPGSSEWLTTSIVHGTPTWSKISNEIARLSSSIDATGAGEGLPAYFSSVVLDGFPLRTVVHPLMREATTFSNATTFAGVRFAEIVTARPDAEWSGGAAPVLGMYSWPGALKGEGAVSASYGGSAISKPGYYDAGSLSYSDIRGAFAMRGMALNDSAGFSAGLSVRRTDVPVGPLSTTAGAAAFASALTAASNVDGARLANPSVAKYDAISGFAHLDWRVAPKHSIVATLQGADVPQSTFRDDVRLDIPESSGFDLFGGVTLHSRINPKLLNSAQVSVTSSKRETLAGTGLNTLASDGSSFGSANGAVSADEMSLRAFDAIERIGARHSLKVGGEVALSNYKYAYRPDAGSSFVFGSVDAVDGAIGYYTRTTGSAPAATWSAPKFGIFVQDSWRNGEGLEVVVGVRADNEQMTSATVASDTKFRSLTGVESGTAPTSAWRLSPRLGVRWDVKNEHAWLVNAAATVVQDRVDPVLVNNWIVDNGNADVERTSGALTGFPDGDPAATVSASRLTLFSPGFRGPQTTHVSGGLSRDLGGDMILQLSAAYRDTKFLPRVSDLNLFPAAAFRDPFGRAVFGSLEQFGSLIAAKPGANRRFPEYDEVSAIQSDGRSQYTAVTARVVRSADIGMSLLASYTLSRTMDNAPGLEMQGYGSAFANVLATGGEDWTDGRSDLDVPQRAVAAIGYRMTNGLSAGLLYRRESGRPFTPGFRAGTDMNGDGEFGNDPAFVSGSITGTDAAIAAWPCLASQLGHFAERNACRGAAVQALDVRLGYSATMGGVKPTFAVEVFDALGADRKRPDSALYLVDSEAALAVSGTTVTVPLMLNPNFGQPVAQARIGRRVRISVSLNW